MADKDIKIIQEQASGAPKESVVTPTANSGLGFDASKDPVAIPAVSQPEAEAGTSTELRSWSPERVGQAIAALGNTPEMVLQYSKAGNITATAGGATTITLTGTPTIGAVASNLWTVPSTGLYGLYFRASFSALSYASGPHMFIWIKRNGSNYVASGIALPPTGQSFAMAEFVMLSLTAAQTIGFAIENSLNANQTSNSFEFTVTKIA